MIDGAIPYIKGAFGALGIIVVCIGVLVWIYILQRDYGFSPVRIFKSLRFAFRKRLLWWQRRRPGFELTTKIFVGLPGSGKTLMLTREAILLMRQGVRVLSNYRIVDPLSGQASIIIRSWYDLLVYTVSAALTHTPTVFCIDEVHLWASSRMFTKTPAWVLSLWSQRRHFGIGILGTTQAFNQVEIAMRRVTDYVMFVRPLFPYYFAGRSLPIFVTETVVSTALNDDGTSFTSADRDFVRMPWWVYGGYNTTELVAVEEWAEDEDISIRIADLTSAAQVAVLVEEFEHVNGSFRPDPSQENVDELVQTLLEVVKASTEEDPNPTSLPSLDSPIIEGW